MTGVPVGLPFASSSEGLPPLKAGAAARTSAGNTARETPVGSSEGSGRTGRRQLAEIADQLSPRDWAILRSVADNRFLTTAHVQALHFSAHATPPSASRSCRRVLERLGEKRLVATLRRRIGGVRAGSSSYVWKIGPAGARLLAARRGHPLRRYQEPAERFLRHALAIADTDVALVSAHRQGIVELLSVELEPACWRPFFAAGGNRAVLQPDLAVTTGAGDYEDAWFIEVDLGSEHIPTLVRKCQQYETYRRTGSEQQRFGAFPLVIWLLSSAERVDRFDAALRAARSVDRALYTLTTPDGLLSAITTHNQPERR